MNKATPLFFASFLLLSACDPLSGTIQVSKAFKMLSSGNSNNCGSGEGPFCDSDKVIDVTPGTYNFDFEMQNRTSAVLTIKMNHNNSTATLKIPGGKNIPDNGRWNVTADELGQPFGLNVTVSTDVNDSGLRRETESCTYEGHEQVCYPVGVPGGGVSCSDRIVTRYGSQRVEFILRTTDKKMSGEVLLKQGTEAAAHLEGAKSTQEKIYTHKDFCY